MFKIAIIGPESTGKTALAKQLAEYYNAPWVPEYARDYVENLTNPYTYEDVCNIALKQIEFEKFYENNASEAKFVFFDTDLIITKVWFSYCFDKIPEFLLDQLHSGFFDAYLLCAPGAVAEAKRLARALGPRIDASVIEHSIDRLIAMWEGDEAPEGIAAFFEKRKPRWQS